MCGIAAISPAPGSNLPLTAMSRAALVSLEQRGYDATGAAWQLPDGEVEYVKAPVTASLYARRVVVPTEATGVILHTRWATQGDPARDENNHPVVRPGIVLVHNGIVRNTDLLYLVSNQHARAEVDTDAVAALLGTAKGREVAQRLSLIEGDAALAWFLVGQNPLLHVARVVGRPLVTARWLDGTRAYASTRSTLIAMARAAREFPSSAMTDVREGTYLRVRGGRVTRRDHVPGTVRADDRSDPWAATA
jgi:glucosamine 6-phosphate synthetase-like amidotransferase/phosphosugar isomerase protein